MCHEQQVCSIRNWYIARSWGSISPLFRRYKIILKQYCSIEVCANMPILLFVFSWALDCVSNESNWLNHLNYYCASASGLIITTMSLRILVWIVLNMHLGWVYAVVVIMIWESFTWFSNIWLEKLLKITFEFQEAHRVNLRLQKLTRYQVLHYIT